jgi:plasmid stabilization system protein ParE
VRHEFHPEAAQEFADEVLYYKDRGRGLGVRFASEVRTAIKKILDTPDRWRVIEADVRRYRVRVFPHAVLYTIERDYVLIIAIAHDKRQPGYWRHRVSR